jgi:hypothetical protein
MSPASLNHKQVFYTVHIGLLPDPYYGAVNLEDLRGIAPALPVLCEVLRSAVRK